MVRTSAVDANRSNGTAELWAFLATAGARFAVASAAGALLPGRESAAAMRGYGRWLRQELQTMGPAYVKLGQVLAARQDVPFELADELERLQDRADAEPFEAMGLALPAGVERVCAEPIAAASLAVVFRGVFRDGDGSLHPVVVKAQRPGVRHALSRNLWAIARTLRALAPVSDIAAHVLDVAREYRRSVWRELDYVQEAHNMDRLAAAMRGVSAWNVVPQVYSASPTVLVLEYVPSARLTAATVAARGHDAAAVADALLEAFLHQCMVANVFHGDVHAGNVQLVPVGHGAHGAKPTFVWFDGGSVVACSDAWRNDLLALSTAVLRADVLGAVRMLETMGIVRSSADAPRARRAVSRFLRQALGMVNEPDAMARMASLMDDDPAWRDDLRRAFAGSNSYVLLGKNLLTLSANCAAIDPTFSLLPRSLPLVRRLWVGGTQPQHVFADLSALLRVPARLSALEDEIDLLGSEADDRHHAATVRLLAAQAAATALLLALLR